MEMERQNSRGWHRMWSKLSAGPERGGSGGELEMNAK